MYLCGRRKSHIFPPDSFDPLKVIFSAPFAYERLRIPRKLLTEKELVTASKQWFRCGVDQRRRSLGGPRWKDVVEGLDPTSTITAGFGPGEGERERLLALQGMSTTSPGQRERQK